MPGRPRIYNAIVDAHKDGTIDLSNMPITDVMIMFDCSNYTVRRARKELNIKTVPQSIRKFPDHDKWNGKIS